jgi:hypothetical protein
MNLTHQNEVEITDSNKNVLLSEAAALSVLHTAALKEQIARQSAQR